MKITILGSTGFIGSKLQEYLENQNCEVMTPNVDEILMSDKNYGVVYYCIGLTSDFRDKPYETVEAHVEKLKIILKNVRFEKLIYLSSTRVYQESKVTKEDAPLLINSSDPEAIYNLSKALGESLCLNTTDKSTCVVRIANVIGENQNIETFMGQILLSVRKGKVHFESGANSAKDYISVDDVVWILYKMAFATKYSMYNLASGKNISNLEVSKIISASSKCEISFSSHEQMVNVPDINISRIVDEFSFKPTPISKVLVKLLSDSQDVIINHGK